ncbi:MAG: FAD-binding oxidoreductase [Chloroflexota bacterium]|jgi:glycolate oxidase
MVNSIKPELIKQLRKVAGDNAVLTSPEDLICYGYDSSWLQSRAGAVVLPKSAEQVSEVLKLANRERVPIVIRGAGTGMSGGAVPDENSIVLGLNRMNRIKEIDRVNLVAVVEPGVVTAELQAEVEKLNLFYPPDPASLKQSTLGGNVAEGAGGPRCLKYGSTKDYVLGLEVVLPTGEIIRIGGKLMKDVTGYNLNQLFVGSEGTLGVITEIILRLIPKPQSRLTAMAIFPLLEDATKTVANLLGAGILPSTIEIMDNTTIRVVEEYLQMGLPVEAGAILIIEVDGKVESIRPEIEQVGEVCAKSGASDVKVATTEEESEALWKARRAVSPALGRLAPNKQGEDISIPRSAIPEFVRRVGEISKKYDLIIPVFGHAGDGNLHPNLLFDQRNQEMMERVHQAAAEIFDAAIDLGGTLSGEHGIGLVKQPYIARKLSPQILDLMRRIKATIDPNNILNPGKMMYPEQC